MKVLGVLVFCTALSISFSQDGDCRKKIIDQWINKTHDCVASPTSGNITLRICIKAGGSGSGTGSYTLTFDSTCSVKSITCPEKGLSVEEISRHAEELEESLSTISASNTTNEEDVIFYSELKSNEQGNLYNSSVSDTKVKSVTFDKAVNLTGASFVLREKKVHGVNSAGAINTRFDSSAASREWKVELMLSDRFVAMGFFDSEKKKINPSSVSMSIDTSAVSKEDLCKNAQTETQNREEVSTYTLCKETTPVCAFNQNDSWPTTGCKVVQATDGQVTCVCNHTTVFAVLLSVTVISVPQSVKIVTYVAEVISIIFLLATVFLLWKVRNHVRGDRVKVQICVASSLLCLHILNVLHDAALYNDTACEIVAVLIHYSLLCTACWMLMEGITLFFKTVDSVMRILNGKNARKFSIFRYVFSFTVPALIVLISAAIGFSGSGPPNYMPRRIVTTENDPKYRQCWVSEDFRIAAVIVPVSIVLSCCLLIICRMFYVVYRMSSKAEKFKPTSQRRQTGSSETLDVEHIKAALKATLVLVPVLGIPWFLAFLSSTSHVLMFVNAVVNGLQGIMVFFVYCVIGREVRKAILTSYVRKKYSLSSGVELSSKQQKNNSEQSNIRHATLSTNIVDTYSDVDRTSNKSADDTSEAVEKF